MTKRERLEAEALELIREASPDTIKLCLKFAKLLSSSQGFREAFAEATPPGKEQPPIDVIIALVNEWTEKEGL